MKKQSTKRIVLAKETLRNLSTAKISDAALGRAAGAAFPNSDANTCACPTLSCHPGMC